MQSKPELFLICSNCFNISPIFFRYNNFSLALTLLSAKYDSKLIPLIKGKLKPLISFSTDTKDSGNTKLCGNISLYSFNISSVNNLFANTGPLVLCKLLNTFTLPK